MGDNSFSKINLKQVCLKIGSGATPRGGSKVYLKNGNCTLIRSQNVTNHGFNKKGLVYIREEHANQLKNVEVHKGDVLLNITGDSVARCCQVPDDILPSRVNQHVSIIRPDPSQIDPRFLRYYLISPRMQEIMFSWAGSGGTRKALTKGMIESFFIPSPKIEEQRTIANVLESFDEKIKCNKQINITIESMVHAIFKSWFIDFNPVNAILEGANPFGLDEETTEMFPDSFYDSELGKIPKGWKVKKLEKILSLSRKNIIPNSEPDKLFTYYSFPAYDERKFPTIEKGENIKSNKYELPQGAILISKLNPGIPRVWMTDRIFGDNAIVSTEFLICLPKQPFFPEFLYSLFNRNIFISEFSSLITGTSKSHQRVKPSDFLSIETVVPDARVLLAFEKITKPLYKKVKSNMKENHILAEIRDLYLPKLISGTINVKDYGVV